LETSHSSSTVRTTTCSDTLAPLLPQSCVVSAMTTQQRAAEPALIPQITKLLAYFVGHGGQLRTHSTQLSTRRYDTQRKRFSGSCQFILHGLCRFCCCSCSGCRSCRCFCDTKFEGFSSQHLGGLCCCCCCRSPISCHTSSGQQLCDLGRSWRSTHRSAAFSNDCQLRLTIFCCSCCYCNPCFCCTTYETTYESCSSHHLGGLHIGGHCCCSGCCFPIAGRTSSSLQLCEHGLSWRCTNRSAARPPRC